jgi:hypothetical protein
VLQDVTLNIGAAAGPRHVTLGLLQGCSTLHTTCTITVEYR